jgi:carbamoyltransferase
MIVFGFGGSGHDFSTCVFQDGKIKCLIEDERVLRIKHCISGEAPVKLLKNPALSYCEKETGLSIHDADYLVSNSSLENYYLQRNPRKSDIIAINHHKTHAASAFYPSEFKSAAILVIDGSGLSDVEGRHDTISMWQGNENSMEKLVVHTGKAIDPKNYQGIIFPDENSIGAFYHIVTCIIGFGGFDEGKTMGLAPYGTSKYYKMLREMVDLGEEGSFIFKEEAIISLLELKNRLDLSDFQVRADLAYATQCIAEEAILHTAGYLKSITNAKYLCLAGGVFLNSVANYKLYKTGMFENIFIQAASGDNGTSIGAAYYGAYELGKYQRKYSID